MKKTMMSAALLLAAWTSFAQADTTSISISKGTGDADTVRVGSIIIIKKPGDNSPGNHSVDWHHKPGNSRLQTSWIMVDLGFSNLYDQTNYSSPATLKYTGGQQFDGNDFDLNSGKCFNINVWLFRQRFGITKNNVLGLTYGLMIETNNYRFENNISFRNYGDGHYVAYDTIDFKKNKLATSYFTVPVMLGFNTRPHSERGFTASAGVSIGYLYSSRNKQISDERGKQKIKSGFGLETWKFQVVAEMGVGPVKVYGAYAPKSLFKDGLDMRPYNIGLRLGGWD